MSANKLAIGIHPVRHLFSVSVYNRVVAFLPLASLLCDPNNLIAPGFFLDGALGLSRQVLHVDGSFVLCLRCESQARGEY